LSPYFAFETLFYLFQAGFPIGDPPVSASQVAGISGMQHHTQHNFPFFVIRFILKALNEVVEYLTAFFNHKIQNSVLKFYG
jgi:hypothetical protein